MTQPGLLGNNAPRRGDWIGRKLAELERMIRQMGVVGIPAGGTAGEVLSKVDGTDYNAAWAVASALPVRATVSYTTAALAAGATENGSVVMATAFRLVKLDVSAACRVRVYGSAGERTADAARSWGTDPPAGLSLILDYLTVAAMTPDLSPLVDGASTEAVPSSSIPIAITASGAGAVTVTFTFLRTE